MALNMEALLKIKADVQGEGAVQGLANKLGGLQKAGSAVSGGFKGLAGAAGGLVGGLQTLMPLATGAGMVALAKNAIDAADNMNDLSQKTGVSVERLSQFKQAADKSGTSIEGVGSALVKLNRGLVDGKAQEALQGIGISATDAAGKLKPTDEILLEVSRKFAAMPDGAQKSAIAMQLFGKSGADMIPMLNMGDKAIKDLSVTMTGDFAKGADEFNDKMVDLQTGVAKIAVSLGTALMPALGAITDALVGLIGAFNSLPGPLQGIISGIGLLVISFGLLAPAIASVIQIAGALAGLQLGATIAGWLGAVGPAVAGMTAALSGLLSFIGTTLLPGLLAFFSGPVGWTVLAVAAVVAMAIAFRKPLSDFVKWLWNWGEPIRRFWVDLWNSATTSASNAFKALGNSIKNVFRSILQSIANNINSISGLVNRLISSFNRLPGPDIPLVPMLSVPAFAKGGYVGGGTLAMVGEAGPEYIIPERKMMQASMNYLNGVRGGAVIPAYASGGYVGGNAQINVTTGPVMQQGGQQYVSMADLEKAMRKTADGIYASLRTPAGRYAVGVR
jgi:phage-related minor tail protein